MTRNKLQYSSMLQEHAAIIGAELNLTKRHVAAALKLFDDGATIPFVARYRKEATGSMSETVLKQVKARHEDLTELDDRKKTVLDAMRKAGALTPELEAKVKETLDPVVLDDLYMPYKVRRRTRAQVAREAGLEPLADIIFKQEIADPSAAAKKYLNPAAEINDVEQALEGAMDIIAERVSESAKARPIVRAKFNRTGVITGKVIKGCEENPEARKYENYFNFSEPVRAANSHRYLALRRGEQEGFLKVEIQIDDVEMVERLSRMFVRPDASAACSELVKRAVADGYKRLLRPSIENKIAATLKDRSDDDVITIFSENLSQLLMEAPLANKRIMAIDPGFRTGCKVVCLDQQGNILAQETIYPNPPANDQYGAADKLMFLVDRHGIDIIAIGNGTAGRDTERFVNDIQFNRRVQVMLTSEQGASVYSASDTAVEELPDMDVTMRGAVSIGRRVLDPMAELVKIDPQSIGVGQYQHDVNQGRLRKALEYTVSQCVNAVGVNLNTAGKHLLGYVSGIGPALAENIVNYRREHGDFTNRNQLMNVPRMGEKTFQQCAGFLRIPRGENVLDATGIHPESYPLIERIAADAGVTVEELARDKALIHKLDLEPYITRKVGLPTLTDIVLELEKPGRDPREPKEAHRFDDTVRRIDDLHLGMELVGKVNNITAFGVFVDLGLKENGLIHISQLSDEFISSPYDIVKMGQSIRVRVLDVDAQRGRIALTIKGVSQKL